MKALVRGVWQPDADPAAFEAARIAAGPEPFRHTVTAGGDFTVEPGRYRLYVSFACPFAH